MKEERSRPAASADLRIWPKSTDPHDLTRLLGLEPTLCHRMGEPYASVYGVPDGGPLPGRLRSTARMRQQSTWVLQVIADLPEERRSAGGIPHHEAPLHLRRLLDLIEPSRAEIERIVANSDEYFVRICLSSSLPYGHGSFVLPPGDLAAVASLCHEFYFSWAGSDEGDDADEE